MKFELHCHSHYSKGSKIPWEGIASPRDIIRFAKKNGLSGVAITDHDTIQSWKEAASEARKLGIIFIQGEEISTANGHTIALGINEPIPSGLSVEETVEKIHEQGGLAVAPHPFDLKGDGLKNKMEKTDVIEVFNALNIDKISNWFTGIKAKNLGKPLISGSDAHTKETIGLASNVIEAHDVDSLIKQIKRGNVEFERNYMTSKMIVEWTRERLTLSYFDILQYISENYTPPRAWISRFFLNKFIVSRNRSWNILADVGLNVSRLYEGMRIWVYY